MAGQKILALALLMVAGCGGSSDQPDTARSSSVAAQTFTSVGSITLSGGRGTNFVPDRGEVGAACAGRGGYGELRAGGQVVVTDASGMTIAVGSLSEGAIVEGTYVGLGRCAFPFTVRGVPSGERFYGIQVTQRGVLQKTEAQMRDPASLAFTLG